MISASRIIIRQRSVFCSTTKGQGWMYLANVVELYSLRIIGWFIHKRMTIDLVYLSCSSVV